MGSSYASSNLLSGPINITDAYTGNAKIEGLDVRAFDSVTLLVSITQGSLTSLAFKPFNLEEEGGQEYEILEVVSGQASVIEGSLDLSADKDFALRIDTRGMNYLTMKFKGNTTSGTLDSVKVVKDGSNTQTPRD